jgi:hypothetical protein
MYSKNTQVHDTPSDLEKSASNLAAAVADAYYKKELVYKYL